MRINAADHSGAARRRLLLIVKLAVAASLIWYALASGKLNLDALAGSLGRPLPLLAGGACVLAALGLAVARWRYLVLGQAVEMGWGAALRLSLVGLFFSSLLPGAVSGDIVKAYYSCLRDPEARAGLILSVVLDRFLGLVGIAPLALAATLLNWERVSAHAGLLFLARLVLVGSLALALGLVLLFWGGPAGGERLTTWLERPRVPSALRSLWQATRRLKTSRGHTLRALTVAVAIPPLVGLGFLFFAQALGEHGVSLLDHMFIIPFVVLSMAVPIVPAGVGVGQLAAAALYAWVVPGAGPSLGADVVTLLQAWRLLAALPGGLLYPGLKDAATPGKSPGA